MRSYRSNITVEPYQQSSTDMPATNNQMSDRGMQTDITFVQKSQVAVTAIKSFDDNNFVMKPISPIISPKEEKPKIMPICNRYEFFVESRKIEESPSQ